MSRLLKPRAAQPVLAPKNKTLRAASTPEGAEAPVVLYGAAKLRADTLQHTKVYCALHQLQMQDFMSEAVEEKLRALGYLPALPDEESPR